MKAISGVLGKELFWTAAAQVLLVLQGVLQVKLLTTFLTRSEYGEWALLASIALLVGMLPFSALDQGVARIRGGIQVGDSRDELFGRVFIAYSVILVPWCVVICAAAWWDKRLSLWVASGLIAFSATEVYRNGIASYNNAARNRVAVTASRAWDVIAKSAALLLLAIAGRADVGAILWSLAAVNAIGTGFFWRLVCSRGANTPASFRTSAIEVLKFSWPLAVWAAFGWAQPMVARWYLTQWATAADVAGFAVVISVALFVPNFAYAVASSYLLPIVYGRAGPTEHRLHVLMTIAFGAALVVFAFLTIIFGREMVTLLTAQKYAEVATYVPWVTASAAINFAAALYASELFRAGATRKLLIPTILPGLLSVVLGFVLIPRVGLRGAVVTFIIGQLAYAAATAVVTSRHMAVVRTDQSDHH